LIWTTEKWVYLKEFNLLSPK